MSVFVIDLDHFKNANNTGDIESVTRFCKRSRAGSTKLCATPTSWPASVVRAGEAASGRRARELRGCTTATSGRAPEWAIDEQRARVYNEAVTPVRFATCLLLSAVVIPVTAACPAPSATLPTVSGISFTLPQGATLGTSATGPVPVSLSWHQTNAGAVKACSYQVQRTSPAVMGTPGTTAIVYTGSQPRTVDTTARQNTSYRYAVRASTCAKQAGPYARDPRVLRTVMFDIFTVAATDFGGFWSTRHNPAFISGEALQATSQPGNPSTFTIVQGATSVGIVSDTEGGRAHVSFDGVPAGRMDITATTPVKYRKIANVKTFPTPAIRTLQLVDDQTTTWNAIVLMFAQLPAG